MLLSHRYMKYLYPYECDKRGLSNPNELQAAIDSNRREGRRQSFGSSLFTYSPNGTPTMLSSPKLSMSAMAMGVATNGASMTPIQKVKKGQQLFLWDFFWGVLPCNIVFYFTCTHCGIFLTKKSCQNGLKFCLTLHCTSSKAA